MAKSNLNLNTNNNNNNGSGNNNGNNQRVDIVQAEEKQIIDQSRSQIQPTNPILSTNTSNNYRSARDSNPDHPTTLLGKLRLKFAPLRHHIFEWRLMHEKSSRRHRRVNYSIGICSAIFWLIVGGFFWQKKTILAQTPVGQTKTFINGDSENVSSIHYDKHNHMALLYLTIHGPNGSGFPMHNLRASFKFVNPPSSYAGEAPTIQLLPLYQDHYVIVVRHIYHGSGALSLQLQDTSKFNPSVLASTVQNDNGNEKPGSPQIGADQLTKQQVQELSAPQSALNSQELSEQHKLLKLFQAHNYQYDIFSSGQFEHNPAHIDSHLSATQILVHIFKKVINHNKLDIQSRQKIIKNYQGQLKTDTKHLKSLYKNSSVSSSSAEFASARGQVQTDKNQIAQSQQEIKEDKQAINQAQNRWNQATSNISNTNISPQPQNRDEQWNNGANGR